MRLGDLLSHAENHDRRSMCQPRWTELVALAKPMWMPQAIQLLPEIFALRGLFPQRFPICVHDQPANAVEEAEVERHRLGVTW